MMHLFTFFYILAGKNNLHKIWRSETIKNEAEPKSQTSRKITLNLYYTMEWFLKVVKEHYADFNGRARRKEFWMFTLCMYAIILAIYVVGIILALIADFLGLIFMGVAGIAMLALIVPFLAVGVRRLHDTGKPTWMIILSFLPVVSLYYLYLMVIEGDKGDNEFGPDPKAGEN